MSRSNEWERLLPMKTTTQHLIAEVPRSSSKVGMTIGIDLGDVWSHYCTLNEDGEVVGRGRFRTSPSGVEKWFTDLPPVRIAMECSRSASKPECKRSVERPDVATPCSATASTRGTWLPDTDECAPALTAQADDGSAGQSARQCECNL